METKNENTPVVIQQPEVMPVSMFTTKDAFEHIQRVAKMFAGSDLVPKDFKNNIGNCVIALEISNRIGASPLMVMQNMHIIHGKPAWSSKFLIATLNSCGRFSPLRYEEDDQDGGRTRAWAYDRINDEKIYGPWVSMKMAEAEGWVSKSGSKWKTMPELMRRYRAASFFTNQFAPEVSMGLQTTEEVYDIGVKEEKLKPVADKTEERKQLMLADCATLEEVEQLQESNPDWDIQLFENRKEEIRNAGK